GRAALLHNRLWGQPELPQWSPAFIGRERWQDSRSCRAGCGSRNGALPLSAGRGSPSTSRATTDSSRNGALPLSAGRATSRRSSTRAACPPQWSPAFIGRERAEARQRIEEVSEPQWSPAFIGRERPLAGRRISRERCAAAMEPCLYRQGEGLDV